LKNYVIIRATATTSTVIATKLTKAAALSAVRAMQAQALQLKRDLAQYQQAETALSSKQFALLQAKFIKKYKDQIIPSAAPFIFLPLMLKAKLGELKGMYTVVAAEIMEIQ